MTNSFVFNEADVRALATDRSFERGSRYYRNEAVFDVIQRGDLVTAKVEGSGYESYQIGVELDASGVRTTNCTCPYDWGGICKHIVAVLLLFIHSRDQVESKPEVSTLIKALNEDQLRQLVIFLADEGPKFAKIIEQAVKWVQDVPTGTAVSNPQAATIDLKAIRREIKKDFRLAGKDDPDQHGYFYDEYAGLEVYPDEILQPHLEKIGMLLDAGDVDTAVATIRIIFDAFIDGLTDLDEWVYEYNTDVFNEANLTLGAALAEIILSQTIDPSEKEGWEIQINDWEDGLGNLEIAKTALAHGWIYPPLVAAMGGNITRQGAWAGQIPDFADELTEVRLGILARRAETEAYINLAQAEGKDHLAVNMSARTGQVKRAVSDAKSYLSYPHEILSLGKLLMEKGELAAALDVAEFGLTMEQDSGRGELARWISHHATDANNQTLALEAAQVAFKSGYHLADYQKAEELAGQKWDAIKPSFLESLQQNGCLSSKIDVYLHEKMILEAMRAYDNQGYANDHDLHRLIEAARETKPDWCIRKCKGKAEAIMDGGESQSYDTAVSWLQIAHDIYKQHRRRPEWQDYLETLLQKHQRKYKLVPMLQNIR